MQFADFLSTIEMKSSLSSFQNKLRAVRTDLYEPEGFIDILDILLTSIQDHATDIDSLCRFNIESIGGQFRKELLKFIHISGAKEEELSAYRVFCLAYRLLCELEFHKDINNEPELHSIHNYVDKNHALFPTEIARQLHFAIYLMPARIASRALRDPAISSFKDFSNSVENSIRLKKQWEDENLERSQRLEALSDQIKKLSSDYNFVNLVHGFSSIRTKKNKELLTSFVSAIALALLLLAAPAIQISFILANLNEIESHKLTLVYSLPSLVAIELFILYFFRIVLLQFRSVKAQLLQIDLRIALCQFIEGYSDYASKIRKQDASSLKRFESLIFSGLVLDGSDIPSTFDGLDQLTGILKSLKGNS